MKDEMDVTAFGFYTRASEYAFAETGSFADWDSLQNWTWATLPFTSWLEWDWEKWDSVKKMSGWPVDIGSDVDGNVWALHEGLTDKGETFDRTIVLGTDLGQKQALRYNKRVLQLNLFFKKTPGTKITVSGQVDQAGWQELASEVELDDTKSLIVKQVPCDLVGSYLHIKIVADGLFYFLGVDIDHIAYGWRRS